MKMGVEWELDNTLGQKTPYMTGELMDDESL